MIVDLFAGAGGWDLGAHALGLGDVLGVENWDKAVETRDAIAEYIPTVTTWGGGGVYEWMRDGRVGPTAGLIASPPCQAWSRAGKQRSIADQERVLWYIQHHKVDPDLWTNEADWVEPTTPLILVPWWAAWCHRPQWLAFEQVEPVLPVWEAMAKHFEAMGYHTWTGILDARDYGVPQRRRRAILIAHLDRQVIEPAPTHIDPAKVMGDQGVFETIRLEPWVSMREAFVAEGVQGWDDPMEVGFAPRDDTGRSPDGYRTRDWFPSDGPAQTVTEKTRSWTKRSLVPGSWGDGRGSGHRREYPDDECAPTLAFGKDMYAWRWLQTGRDWRPDGTSQAVSEDNPAPTLTSQSRNWQWADRPATTVQGDSRLWPPGHKINQGDIDRLGEDEARQRYGDRAGTDAMQMTLEEALVLQTFPANTPIMGGSKRATFTQVGNAVPPLLAYHILREASGA